MTALLAACREADVDHALIFEHMNAHDLKTWGDAIETGDVPSRWLPKWMQSIEQTIRGSRCLCRACVAPRKGVRA